MERAYRLGSMPIHQLLVRGVDAPSDLSSDGGTLENIVCPVRSADIGQETLNYAPVVIGAITVIALGGWFFPVWGGKHWFQGPKRTISEAEVLQARIKGDGES